MIIFEHLYKCNIFAIMSDFDKICREINSKINCKLKNSPLFQLEKSANEAANEAANEVDEADGAANEAANKVDEAITPLKEELAKSNYAKIAKHVVYEHNCGMYGKSLMPHTYPEGCGFCPKKSTSG